MKKMVAFCVVSMACLSAAGADASVIYASDLERMIYDNDHCYLENYNGQTNLGNPDLVRNLLGESDSLELGWRKPTPINGFVVGFAEKLMDGTGADLVIRDYGPGTYSVYASVVDDDAQYVKIGDSTAGEPGVFNEYGFDFAGLNDVKYIKIMRTSFAPYNGRFFDSFQGNYTVPEPCTLGLLALGGFCALRRKES